MCSLGRIGLLLLFMCSAFISIVKGQTTLSAADEENKLLAQKIDKIFSNTRIISEGLSGINIRLSALEEKIQKAKLACKKDGPIESCAALKPILRQHCKDVDAKLDKILRRLNISETDGLDEIVENIRNRRFNIAGEKLIARACLRELPIIVEKVYDQNQSNFHLLLVFAKSMKKIPYNFEILKLLHQQMLLNGHNDTLNLIILGTDLEIEVISNRVDPNAAEATKIVNELKQKLKVVIEDLLIEGMTGRPYKENPKLQQLAAAFAIFHPESTDDLMHSVVSSTFGNVESSKILDNLFSLRSTSQAISGVVALFWKVKEAGSYSSNLMIDLSYALSQLKTRSDFANLSELQKAAFENVVIEIPPCARNLFFEKHVCLWNKAKQSYALAAGNELLYDSDRRPVFSYAENTTSIPRGAPWTVRKINDRIIFWNYDFKNEGLYAANITLNKETRYAYTWVPGRNTDRQSAWNIELLGDQCQIKNIFFDKYLYASDIQHTRDWRFSYVGILRNNTLRASSDLLWEIRGCIPVDRSRARLSR